jgi:hypothetical protein
VQDLSFRWPHPRFATTIGELAVRVHTGENVYGLDPEALSVTTDAAGVTTATATRLTWAGGQRTAEGGATVTLVPVADGVAVTVRATHADGVRCVALTLYDQPRGNIVGVRETELTVPDQGRTIGYPNGWWDLATPFLAVDNGDSGMLVLRCRDRIVRSKRVAVIPHVDETTIVDIDLIADADAAQPSSTLDLPAWEITREAHFARALARHTAETRADHGLPTWAQRSDVPDWLHDISLVATLHGMHFTGRVFLDYAAMLETLRRLVDRIDGHRILAYLPGWEGRYYRWYGRYDVDETLGGAEGFHRLIAGAHDLGVRVMPMFGANFAARDLPGFETWAAPGLMLHASGHPLTGSVDWDASRHYDHGWGALINPGYGPWREHLAAQIIRLQHEYGFDAAFLDIAAQYYNDPRASTTEGLRALVARIHRDCPDLLVAGEGWFDAISAIIPLVQSGHRDTVPVLHDQTHDDLFTGSARSFGHVCLGDPAHGSTGVHEAGYNPAWRLPVREAVIPTLSVVDGTLDLAPDRVNQLIADAHAYAAKFLSPLER